MQRHPLGWIGFLRPYHTLSAALRICTATLMAVLALIAWGEAQAVTPVSGNITTDTTWTLANSPYEVTDLLTVRENATLTIDPGVQVRVAEMTHIQVYGSLVAHGTESAPIRFSGTTAQSGWWYGISVSYTAADPAAVSFDHVIVEHAGYSNMESYGALDVGTANAEIRHSLFQNNGNNGVNFTLDGPVILADSQFINNGWHAVRIYGYYAAYDPQLSNLSASGNGKAGAGYDAVVYVATAWKQGEHTLEAMGLPYVFRAGFNVEPGGRLILEPGIEVRVDSGFYVRGELEAVGTAAQPITLTGIKKEPGGWWGLNVAGVGVPALAHLEHVVVEYGGQTTYEDSANITVSSANLVLRHSIIRNGGGHGIYNSGGAPDEAFAVAIEDTQFVNNARAGVVCDDESCKQTASGLTATGNGINGLVYRNSQWGAVTWKNAGIPYWVEGSSGISEGDTMTLEPGTEVRMAQGAWLDVRGELHAVGTPEQPIVFTGTQQQPGWWRGITAAPNAILELRYCDVGYGGQGGQGGQLAPALIELATNGAVVSDCDLHHSGAAALRTYTNVAPLITRNRIDRTNAAGLINNNGTRFPLTVDARGNWWGDASGPAHATNPGGTGASVSDRVLYDPWMTTPDEQTTADALELHLAGGGRYTAGETVQYAISYANPTTTTVQNAVLRVALPANSTYLDSTGAAVYWAERRQVFWKLGTLAPGATGLVAVRVTYAWGLPEGIKTAIMAELDGQGVDPQLFDVAEYLAYQPRLETAVTR